MSHCPKCGIEKTTKNCSKWRDNKSKLTYQYYCKVCWRKKYGHWYNAKVEDIWWKRLELYGLELLLDIEEVSLALDRQTLLYDEYKEPKWNYS